MFVPPRATMMRSCAEPISFVQHNGLDNYQRQFNNVVTHELLMAEEYYKETWGPRVTKKHICDYIRYWGMPDYITNCSPDSTYVTLMADEEFCAAQILFEKEPMGPALYGHFRMVRTIQDPYYRNIRDHKGVLIPEPPIESNDNEYDIDKIYIYTHGIVNYVLYSGIKIEMTTLLASRSVAIWQRCYIERVLPLDAR
jgi:hypothetical protein